jgi:multiple sugar transport system permease protein
MSRLAVSMPWARRTPPRASFALKEAIAGYLFISPWIIGFLLFTAGPILAALGLSFTRYTILSPARFVGLQNYANMLDDELVSVAIFNTTYFVFISVPLRIAMAFGLALLLNTEARGRTIYRSLYYLPVVVPQVAASVLWMWILQPYFGLLNHALSQIGLSGPQWLYSEVWSKPAIILMRLWHIGGPAVIFLAGLQGISRELYEAAEIDGASAWRKTISITIPLMTPVILFNLIMDLIQSFQVFTSAFIMTKGGPVNSTLFYLLYIYRHAFVNLNMGYACALSTAMFVLILAVTVLVMRSSSLWVHYESQ